MILLPMAECEIVDNWHSLGMRGTGSNDVRARDVVIPSLQVVTPAEPGRGETNRYYQGALYRCPGRIIFATYVPVTLVLAERALALGIDRRTTVVAFGGGVTGDLAGFLAASLLRGLDFVIDEYD